MESEDIAGGAVGVYEGAFYAASEVGAVVGCAGGAATNGVAETNGFP
jgi:hypothetical protein